MLSPIAYTQSLKGPEKLEDYEHMTHTKKVCLVYRQLCCVEKDMENKRKKKTDQKHDLKLRKDNSFSESVRIC